MWERRYLSFFLRIATGEEPPSELHRTVDVENINNWSVPKHWTAMRKEQDQPVMGVMIPKEKWNDFIR